MIGDSCGYALANKDRDIRAEASVNPARSP
jgi:hypothetical protein